jgi:prepilin peptidase CpaA
MDALPATLPAWIEWATLATVFVGMVWDGARLRIPHSVCLVILVLMPAWALLQPDGVSWLSHLLGFAIAFVVGFVLWRLRWFGGGDVKFLSAIALWFGLRDLGSFLVAVSLLGAIFAVLLVALRAAYDVLPHKAGESTARRIPLLQKGDSVPYGIAIGLAAFLLRGGMFDIG